MSKISYVVYYLPERILNNKQLEREFPEWNSEKIADKIGIKQRHISEKDQTALDLGFKAAYSCLHYFRIRNGKDF
jgi:3-oxoacyl-[acyl-carrier-protein] synthase-3